MKYLIIMISLMLLPGCANMMGLVEDGADAAARGINEYCGNTDADFRAGFRAEVNEAAAPHSAAITCAE